MVLCEKALTAINQKLEPHEKLSHVFISAEVWGVENGMLTPTLKMKRAAIEKLYEAQAQQLMSASNKLVQVI